MKIRVTKLESAISAVGEDDPIAVTLSGGIEASPSSSRDASSGGQDQVDTRIHRAGAKACCGRDGRVQQGQAEVGGGGRNSSLVPNGGWRQWSWRRRRGHLLSCP